MSRAGTLRERFEALPVGSPADRLRLRAGSMADYGELAAFHYLGRRPATVARVLALEDERPSIAARFVGGPGRARARAAAVLVESMPVLNCAPREAALGGRYRGWGDRGAAARLLNAEVRCISRVVVHPRWRGLGLAAGLVRAALRSRTTRYTEALAAMGRVHPFFERAGMRAHRGRSSPANQRLIDALRWAGLEPWELASVERATRAVEADRTGLVRRELRRWARGLAGAGGSKARGAGADWERALRLAGTRLLCEPVYYIHGPEPPRTPPESPGRSENVGERLPFPLPDVRGSSRQSAS